ncbi:NAD(P)-dependent oxidoreductase, partial [Oscillibacter sp.]
MTWAACTKLQRAPSPLAFARGLFFIGARGTDAAHACLPPAITLLLEICHHIGYHNDTVKSGKWEQCPDWCYWDYPLIELAGKTYGLLGCGNIGIHTAAIASALGMNVIAYDMRQRDEALQLGVEYVSLDELFARSDVLGL